MTPALHATLRFAAGPLAVGTVLLIEDDVLVARSLIGAMTAEGYVVVHAASAPAALEQMMSRSFDAVISDASLPWSSGVDVLNVVRTYEPDVPLVLMTGSPRVGTTIEAGSLGVLEYLVIPATRDQLVHVLGRCAKARRAAIQRRGATEAAKHAAATATTVRPTRLLSDARGAARWHTRRATDAPAGKPAATVPPTPDSGRGPVSERGRASASCPSVRVHAPLSTRR